MEQGTAVFRTYFDREKNVLIARGNPGPIHQELELHLLSIGAECDRQTLGFLKDGLAAMALYLVSRPRFESFGWTVSLKRPLRNLFFSGSAREHTVVGRAFVEGVKEAATNRFYAQVARPFGELATSSVEVEGTDIFSIVEQYCRASDQQPARFFQRESREAGEEAFVSVLPDADREWFESVDREGLLARISAAEPGLIAEHEVSFRCGCDTDRITRVIADLYRDDPEDLFRGDPLVEVECPRCGTQHQVLRARFDAA
jgi:hypothetical protein